MSRNSKRATGFFSALAVLAAAASVTGCSPIVFQGKANLVVIGDPPPPPPPPEPPPPEPEEPKRVKIVDNKIVIGEKIQFDLNRATIKEVSHDLLNEIAKILEKNSHVKKVNIEGHASSEGLAAHNRSLSANRAKAVLKYLAANGVEADRLSSEGFGSDKPVADNDTPEGREKNRRVEFNIVEQEVTEREVPVQEDDE